MAIKKIINNVLSGSTKKFIIGAVATVYLTSTVVTPAFADTFVGSQYPILYNQLVQQVQQVMNFPLQSTSDAESELVDIMNIEQVVIWDDYITNGTSLHFPSSQITAINQNLQQKITEFNKYFNTVASGSTGVIDTSQSSLWKDYLNSEDKVQLQQTITNMTNEISQLEKICNIPNGKSFTNLESQVNAVTGADKASAQSLYKQYVSNSQVYMSLQNTALDQNTDANATNMKSVTAQLTLKDNSTNSLVNLVNTQLPAIVSQIDSKIAPKFKGISSTANESSSPNSVVQQYYPITKFSYVDVLTSTQTVDIIKGITGNQVDSSWEFQTSGMSDLLTKYSAIMAIGKQELAESFGAFTDNNINGDQKILFNQFTSNYKLAGQQTPIRAVNRAYLSCLAASATYIPLESKWANPVFMNSLEYINKNQAVVNAYSEAYNFVKPLYFRASSYSSTATNGNNVVYNGSATRVTLADLYKYVQNGTYGELVTGKYSWKPTSTAGNWVFANNQNTALDVTGYGDSAGNVVSAQQAEQDAKNSTSSTTSTGGSSSNSSNNGSSSNNGGTSTTTSNNGSSSNNGGTSTTTSNNGSSSNNGGSSTTTSNNGSSSNNGGTSTTTSNNGGPSTTTSTGGTPAGTVAGIIAPKIQNVTLLADPQQGQQPVQLDSASHDLTNANKTTTTSTSSKDDKSSSDSKTTTTTPADNSKTTTPADNSKTTTTDGNSKTTTTDGNSKTTTTDGNSKTTTTDGNSNTSTNTNTQGTSPSDTVVQKGITLTDTDGAGDLESGESISNPSKLTAPFFEFNPWTAKGGMSLFLLGNILNSPAYKKVANPESQYLFVDAFGDIVTQSGLVVIPGASNPAYYGNTYDYYVGTAAFLNTYPSISANADGFQVTNSNEVGDSLLATSPSGTSDKASLSTIENVQNMFRGTQGMDAYKITSKTSLEDTSSYNNMMSLDTQVVNNDGSISDLMTAAMYKSHSSWGIVNAWKDTFDSQNSRLLFQLNSKYSSIIPLQPNNQNAANYLADETYKAMVVGPEGQVMNTNGRFDVVALTEVLMQGLDGSSTTSTYIANCMNGQQTQSQEYFGIINSLGQYLLNAELSFLGDAKGVIGVLGAYQNKVFGTLLCYVTTYWFYFFIVFLLYFIAMFARRRTDWTVTTFNILSMLLIGVISVTLAPLLIPEWYNEAGSHFAQKMVYSQILMDQSTPPPANTTNPGYTALDSSPSITVYTGGLTNTSQLMKSLQTSKFQLFTGTPLGIPGSPGFYAQGNQLQYNVKQLLGSYIIHLDTSTGTDGIANTPKLEIIKKQSSNIDYWCPLSPIMQSFTNNLNVFSSAYNMTPKYIPTSGGQAYKSAYVVNAFTNSRVFLQPQLFLPSTTTTPLQITPSYLVLRKYFTNPVDWLGLSSILIPNSPYKNTLWFQQFIRDGYLQPQNKNKLLNLIANVNNQTKEFVMSIQDQIPDVTDSVLIKTISLYATTVFDDSITEPGHEIYPQGINFQDMTLDQTFQTLMTDPTSKYIGSSDNLSQFILLQYGTLGIWLSTLVLPLAFLIAFLIKWLIPIMYVLLLIVIILRLAFNKEANVAVKGYFKLSSVIWLSFVLFSWATCALQDYSGSNIVLFLLLALYLIIVGLLVNVLLMLIGNLMDMGNAKFDARLESISDKLKTNNFLNKLSANSLDIGNRMKASEGDRAYRVKETITNVVEDRDETYYEEDTINYVKKHNTSRFRRRRNKSADSYDEYDLDGSDDQ